MSSIRLIAAIVLLTSWAFRAEGAAIPGLFNTGVDGSGAVLPGGSVDPHYALIASADPAYPGPSAIVASVIPAGYWRPNGAASMWIAPAADENWPALGTAHPDGTYRYRLSFDLTGFDPATVSISGTWGADNSCAILLNGAATGFSTSSYNPLVPFSVTTGFVNGVNHLDFDVANWTASGSNPTGLRVEGIVGTGTSTAGVGSDPEPGTLELIPPFPNPAREIGHISYSLPRQGKVRLVVLDLAGRTVRTLVDREEVAGPHASTWDGRDDHGFSLQAGVYLLDLRSAGQRVTRRVSWLH